jgi:hypothetical protein
MKEHIIGIIWGSVIGFFLIIIFSMSSNLKEINKKLDLLLPQACGVENDK